MSLNELRVENLKKTYSGRKVVNGISYNVKEGEIVGLLGANGAGKTTVFYMSVGFIQPDDGQIFLNNENITPLPMHKRAQLGLGYLPQEACIFRKLTVSENILAILELDRKRRKNKKDLLAKLLEDLEITHIKNSLGYALSGGERRRVEIARCLASEPKFLLLDEPFAGVDPLVVNDIQRIIKYLAKQNIGVLINDHNVRETLGITERAYILNKGEVLLSGTPAEIVENPIARKVYFGENFKV